ncbi:uncharacterized protein [Salminus brasiliensis]|uniref:uncharacterized protein n=1 Tax=Salminus brasiliensis TaxID=930266 RepID=UPI003B82DC75
MELLKKSHLNSKALERLRVKIQQQKLKRTSGKPVVKLMRQGHVTRKVCRVTSRGARIVPGAAGVMGLCARKAYLSPSAPTASHLKPDSKGAALRNKEHSTYISAWREAQKLVKEVLNHQSVSVSATEKDNTKGLKKAPQQIGALNVQNCLKQISDWPNMTENSVHRPTRKNPIGQSTKSFPACKPFILASMNQTPSKYTSSSQASTDPSGSHAKSSAAQPLSLKSKENEGPAKQSFTQRKKSEELYEYMHRQALKRRRKERLMKSKAALEEERKRRSVQEVLKKQKEALQRIRKQPIQEKNRNAEKQSGCVLLEREQVASTSKAYGQHQCSAR